MPVQGSEGGPLVWALAYVVAVLCVLPPPFCVLLVLHFLPEYIASLEKEYLMEIPQSFGLVGWHPS